MTEEISGMPEQISIAIRTLELERWSFLATCSPISRVHFLTTWCISNFEYGSFVHVTAYSSVYAWRSEKTVTRRLCPAQNHIIINKAESLLDDGFF